MDAVKVLIVAGTMNVGGIENQLMHLFRKADKSRFKIDFTTTTAHPFYEEEIRSLGGNCIHIPSTDGKHFLRYCKALYRVMKDGEYDVVHSNELFHSGLVVLTAKLAGVKQRFVHAHSSNQQLENGIFRSCYTAVMRRLILRFGTEFLACSTLAADFLYGKKIPTKSNYHLIFNSVDTARFLPAEDEARPEAGDGWKTVLQVGRFSDEKNQIFTTRIAAECANRGDRICFWLIGNDGTDNPFERAVRQSIADNNLGDRVQLLGIRRDVNELMRHADAFILPSKYEGMPLTLIEAQAACLPCIAADTFSHEVDFGVGGIRWMQLNDPVSAWADAVEQSAAGDRLPVKEVKRMISEKGFDVKDFANRICTLYLQAANKE